MIELDLFPLKYEVNYNDKCYIIESKDYFNNTDETKWIVSTEDDKFYLTKDFAFSNCSLIKIKDFAFDTKDEAINALTIYLLVEDKLEKEMAQLNLSYLYNMDETGRLSGDFLSVHDIETALSKKGCFRINKSNRDSCGVQVSITCIHHMLLLEKVIEEIALENKCKVINIYNHDVPHCSYSSPLYYYWRCGNDFVRQFALLEHLF